MGTGGEGGSPFAHHHFATVNTPHHPRTRFTWHRRRATHVPDSCYPTDAARDRDSAVRDPSPITATAAPCRPPRFRVQSNAPPSDSMLRLAPLTVRRLESALFGACSELRAPSRASGCRHLYGSNRDRLVGKEENYTLRIKYKMRVFHLFLINFEYIIDQNKTRIF